MTNCADVLTIDPNHRLQQEANENGYFFYLQWLIRRNKKHGRQRRVLGIYRKLESIRTFIQKPENKQQSFNDDFWPEFRLNWRRYINLLGFSEVRKIENVQGLLSVRQQLLSVLTREEGQPRNWTRFSWRRSNQSSEKKTEESWESTPVRPTGQGSIKDQLEQELSELNRYIIESVEIATKGIEEYWDRQLK